MSGSGNTQSETSAGSCAAPEWRRGREEAQATALLAMHTAETVSQHSTAVQPELQAMA